MTPYRVPHLIPVLVSLFVLLLCVVFFITLALPKDLKGYNLLLKKIESSEKKEGMQVKQIRKGVQKEIWYTKGSERLQAILQSEEAELCLDQSDQGGQIVEYLHEVTAIIQEKCYFQNQLPMQKIRVIESANAVYYYALETLIADDVVMEEYTLAGHTIPKIIPEAMKKTQTTANQVEVTFKERSLQVEADRIKASSL